MKKLIFFLLYVNVCYSQFELSAFGGIGFSNGYNTRFPIDNSYEAISINSGITAQYNFDGINSIKIETSYSRKGFIQLNNYHIKYLPLNYITISPMAQFNVNEKVKLYFTIGPYFGFLINKDSSREILDMGAQIGLGYKVPIYKNKLSLFIEAKDQIGLLNIKTSGNGYEGTHAFNVVIGVSYKF